VPFIGNGLGQAALFGGKDTAARQAQGATIQHNAVAAFKPWYGQGRFPETLHGFEKRTARNKARKSRVRSFLRKVEEAVKSGDKAAAQEAFRAAQPEMQRAATKGVVHANTVARKLSRLSARVKSVGA